MLFVLGFIVLYHGLLKFYHMLLKLFGCRNGFQIKSSSTGNPNHTSTNENRKIKEKQKLWSL